jgi:flagellar biosynthesis protein FlhA
LVRKRLRDQITQHLMTTNGQLSILHLHPAWESEFVQLEAEAGRGGTVVLAPALSQKLATATRRAIAVTDLRGEAVIATPDHRRRAVRAMLAAHGLAVPVLSLDEIDPAVPLRLLGTIEAG